MNHLRRIVYASIFFVLMGALAFFYWRTEAIDLDAQNQVMLDLRVLKQLDAEWNVNILKSRIGLNNNYDPVTVPLRIARELQDRLAMALDLAKGKNPKLMLDKFNRSFNEKEKLVERFKSQNAILKNSLIYFPIAVESFKVLLHSNVERGAPEQIQSLLMLEAKVSELLANTLSFNLVPDSQLARKIDDQLFKIEQGQANYPAEVSEAIDQVARHARTIVRQRALEDTLLARISIAPTGRYMDDLITAFDQEFENIINEKQRYRSYLLIYSALLLILLGYAGWRVVKSYQVIAQVNKSLVASNELLEKRVAERTAELELQSAQLAELATHDSLTGLVNGGQFMSELTRALLRAERRLSIVVVMFIDLDGFKAVNDTYGHATGDLVLKEVAKRVPGYLRQEDLLARLGGDEFVILLEEVSTKEGAVRVAAEVLNQIKQITSVGGHPVKVSGSIGISCAQGRFGVTYSSAALLDEADHAMYQAKQSGKNCVCFSDNTVWGGSELV